jgi:hypothetical protein
VAYSPSDSPTAVLAQADKLMYLQKNARRDTENGPN